MPPRAGQASFQRCSGMYRSQSSASSACIYYWAVSHSPAFFVRQRRAFSSWYLYNNLSSRRRIQPDHSRAASRWCNPDQDHSLSGWPHKSGPAQYRWFHSRLRSHQPVIRLPYLNCREPWPWPSHHRAQWHRWFVLPRYASSSLSCP